VLLFLFLPLTVIVTFSFFRAGEFGTIIYEPTLENYRRFVNGTVYQRVIGRSLLIGVVTTTLIVLPFGYTLGYFLGRSKSRWTPLLLGLVVVQFWVPLVIRTYAWIPILGRQGIVNDFLLWLGVVSQPVEILYTTHGMILGLSVSILPFMVPASVLDRQHDRRGNHPGGEDPGCERCSGVPGGDVSPLRPGIVSGILFTFILSAGSYLAPQLLGGTGDRLIAPVIETVFSQDFNWPFAATRCRSSTWR